MIKLLGWLANLRSVGKYVKKVQEFFEGKKMMLASLGTAVTGTLTIIAKFSADDGGIQYLLHVASTPEFLAASAGWIGFFGALKGEKIRNENAEIIAKLDGASAEPPKAA